MHIHKILTCEEEIARTVEWKKTYPACPICTKEFTYNEITACYNGPDGAVVVSVEGYYGSLQHDFEGGIVYVCDDCANLLFAMLDIPHYERAPEEIGRLVSLRSRLLPFLRSFIQK